MKKDAEEIRRLKMMANEAKQRLIEIRSRLQDAGADRDANSLGTLIGKIEEWQHK